MFAPAMRFAQLPYIYRVRHDPRRGVEWLAQPVPVHLDAVSSRAVRSERSLRDVRYRSHLLAVPQQHEPRLTRRRGRQLDPARERDLVAHYTPLRTVLRREREPG